MMSHEEKFRAMMKEEAQGVAPALDLPTAPEVSEPKPAFRVDSEDSANWYLRRLATLESEKQRVQSQAALIVAQLQADAESLRFLYESDLQEWTRQELARRGNRRKSLALLQGTACFRTVPAALKISDPAAALAYAVSALPAAVGTRPTLDAEKYRAAANEALKTGQTLPGVESVPARETFAVKFGKE